MTTKTNSSTENTLDQLKAAIEAAGFIVTKDNPWRLNVGGFGEVYQDHSGGFSLDPIWGRATKAKTVATAVKRIALIKDRNVKARAAAEARQLAIAAERPIHTSSTDRLTVDQAEALIAELEAKVAAFRADARA